MDGHSRSFETKHVARLFCPPNTRLVHKYPYNIDNHASDEHLKSCASANEDGKKHYSSSKHTGTKPDHSIAGIMGKDSRYECKHPHFRPPSLKDQYLPGMKMAMIPSDSTKVSHITHDKLNNLKYSAPLNNGTVKRSATKSISKENLKHEAIHMNGFSDKHPPHINSTTNSHSSVSHLSSHITKHAECNSSVSSRDSLFSSHTKDVRNHQHRLESRSPERCSEPQLHSEPTSQSQHHKRANSQRQSHFATRPNSLSNANEFSNEDRSDESKNLTIDNSENAEVAGSEQSPKQKSPYHMDLREGMCLARFVGTVKYECREIKTQEGSFSYGWVFAPKRVQSSESLSASRARTPPVPHTDNRYKRKARAEDPNESTLPKKLEESMIEMIQQMPKNDNVNSTSSAEKLSRSLNHMPSTGSRCDSRNSKAIDNTTMDLFTSKRDRRSVYSGRRTTSEVPALKRSCHEYLRKNILSMKIPNKVPYIQILLPVLETCDSHKLYKVEEQNKHLKEYTNVIWEKKFKQKFRDQVPLERRPWRDTYWKAVKEHEERLKSVTASISNGMSKAQPDRQMKLMGSADSHPEKPAKKPKLEESPRLEMNGKASTSGKSSGSESSLSPHSVQFVQKPPKGLKPNKRTDAPLLSKSKKMMSQIRRR